MTDKIEPWIRKAAFQIDNYIEHHDGFTGRMATISEIIATHAPKQVKVQELSITVGQIQQAIDYGFTISGLEQELTKLIHAAEDLR